MRNFVVIEKGKKSLMALLLPAAFLIFGQAPGLFAHDGEDHGDSKPKTTAGEKGTVSHTARLGDLEIMVKHPLIEPDTPIAARLFITNFQTNAPAEKVNPAIEIESANGTVNQATVEKTDSAGSYNLKIPAMPAGVYTLRAKVTYDGETDTATFSGVNVEATHTAASAEDSDSWGRRSLSVLSAVIISGLFGGLIYSALRTGKDNQAREDIASV